jgi:hypothetical protein
MLCRVALVRTDVSEELSVSFIRVTRIGELGTTIAVTSNRQTAVKTSNLPYLASDGMPQRTGLFVLCCSCNSCGGRSHVWLRDEVIDQWNWPPLGASFRGNIRIGYRSESDSCTADGTVRLHRTVDLGVRRSYPHSCTTTIKYFAESILNGTWQI